MDSRVLQTQEWLNKTYGDVAGFPVVDEDGITGQATFKALIYALQIEIGISTECYKHSIKIDDKKSCLHIRNTTQVNDKCTYELYCCYYYYG